MDLHSRIEAAKDLSAHIQTLKAELAEHEKEILAAAKPAAVQDEKGTVRFDLPKLVKIVWPIEPLKLTVENLKAAKELAGDEWNHIAERIPLTHKLAKAARDLIPALLTPAKAAKLLALLKGEAAPPRITYL